MNIHCQTRGSSRSVGRVSRTLRETAQLLKRPARGGLVDGPAPGRIVTSLKGVCITEPDPLRAFQGVAVYHDDVKDYSSKEPTMDGTAPAVLMFVLCNDSKP